MKIVILASLLVTAVAVSSDDYAIKFETFKLEYGKTYENKLEETKRFAIFTKKVKEIEAHDILYKKGLVTYKKGINQFADLTEIEFRARLTLITKPSINATRYVKTGAVVPTAIDWREQGYVTPVKDQGDCGSCWSFSLTGTMEGAYYRKTGKLVSLSEQQLIDCSTGLNHGCNGGYMVSTFPYLQQNGLESEESYPYLARESDCQYNASKVVAKPESFVYMTTEPELLEAVGTFGPVSVSINANYIGSYSTGVFSNSKCDPKNLNHGVLVVGYGKQNKLDYWIVKNTWGLDWGEEGYIRILRGTNECGIASDDFYPIISN